MNSSRIPQSNIFSVNNLANNNFTMDALGRKSKGQSRPRAYCLTMEDKHSNIIGNAKAGLEKMNVTNKLQQAHNESNYTMSTAKFLNTPKNSKRTFLNKSMKSMADPKLFFNKD
jgi:hypothetical protein